ncbi:MAG: PTS sugar transporter subunit IIA [Planctomycetota bacterium]|nr:PTS sugar transporter subunit IIA [Planctomycetota bacterium]
MKLVNLLSEETVVCPLKGHTREEALNELLEALDKGGYLRNRDAALLAVEERERLGCTSIGGGIALPHARTDTVDGFAVALGTSKNGIDYHSPDGTPVNIVCLILAPSGESTLYVRLLGAIAQLLKDEQTKKSIINATTARQILKIIQKSGIEVEPRLRVRDIMKPLPALIRRETSLKEALDIMFKHHILELPVVDENGILIGEVSIENVLKVGLPEYLFHIDNLAFLSSFEPFERLLRQETELHIHDVMSEKVDVIDVDAPMIQAAILVMREELRSVIVMEKNRPVGMVSLLDFIEKVLRA